MHWFRQLKAGNSPKLAFAITSLLVTVLVCTLVLPANPEAISKSRSIISKQPKTIVAAASSCTFEEQAIRQSENDGVIWKSFGGVRSELLHLRCSTVSKDFQVFEDSHSHKILRLVERK
jgi:hypothetical protein